MPTIKLLNNKRDDRTLGKRRHQKVYQDRRWKKLRREKMRNSPLCETCRQDGRTVPTQHIHHIVPFDASAPDMEARAYDYDNLIALCVECHNKIHMSLKVERR